MLKNDELITKNTIAILKIGKKTKIIDVDNIRVINKGIKKFINDNCLLYGSNLKGRLDAIKKNTDIKYIVPIYVKKEIILIPIISFRKDDTMYLVLNKINHYYEKNGVLTVKCNSNKLFFLSMSKRKFENRLLSGIIVQNNDQFI